MPSGDLSGEYIAGRNLVEEALKAGSRVKKVIIESEIKAKGYSNDVRIRDIIAIALKKGIPVSYMPRLEMRKIEREIGVKGGGICAQVGIEEEIGFKEFFAHFTKKNKEAFFIILHDILYEENLGSILRSSAAGGVDCVIISNREKRGLTAKVRQVSMGGSEYVPLVRDNLFTVLDILKKEGIKTVGVELSGKSWYYDEELRGSVAFILGGESAGVTDPLLKRCDSIVKLPMLRSIQSLNVSVSAGIIIYEKIRQECQTYE